MSVLTRAPRPDPAVLYTSLISFAYASPAGPTGIPRGARYRGDSPLVRATFDLWLPADTPDDELAAARGWLTAPTPVPSPPEPAPETVRMMRCTKVVAVSAELGGQATYLSVAVGEVLPSTSPAVRLRPRNFEPAE